MNYFTYCKHYSKQENIPFKEAVKICSHSFRQIKGSGQVFGQQRPQTDWEKLKQPTKDLFLSIKASGLPEYQNIENWTTAQYTGLYNKIIHESRRTGLLTNSFVTGLRHEKQRRDELASVDNIRLPSNHEIVPEYARTHIKRYLS